MKKRNALSLFLALTMILLAMSVCIVPQKTEAADNKLVLTDTTNYSVSSFKSYLYLKKTGVTVSTLKSAFKDQSTKVFNKSGSELADTATLTTGCQIKLMNGTSAVDFLTVILGGDVDGNGSVNNTDLTKLKAALKTSVITLAAEYVAAGDADMNGRLTVTDYLMLKRHLKGTYKIELVAPYEKITMPDLTGYKLDQAKTELAALRLGYSLSYEYSNTVTKDFVVSQSAAAGTMVMQGTKINLVISLGKDASTLYTPLNYSNNLRAVWLSQFDIPSIFNLSDGTTFTNSVKNIFQKIKDKGFNTVFVQVRPNGDSFFPSDYYPLSKYVTGGSYSATATKSYDALQIMTSEGHKLGLSIHAWINPLRLMSATEITSINSKYLIKKWYDGSAYNGKYIVNVNGTYYLNPAYAETRQLIIDGVKEICDKYDIDGIHFDDYFYPTKASSFDLEAYQNQDEFMLLSDFRRNNVTLMVKGTYDAVKAIDSRIVFGVSPAGNPDTVQSDQYADVNLWCSTNGYIDYIMPQLYYGFNNTATPFKTYAQKWSNKVTASNVKLYAGLALYKACDPSQRNSTDGTEWNNSTDILKREIEYLGSSLPKYKGVSVYCYGYFNYTTGATEAANLLSAMNSVYAG